MKKQAIATTDAPGAVGPYSQGILANGLVFVSGQVPLDPATGQLVAGADIESHTRQVLENVRAVLLAAGSDLKHLVKTTIFLTDLADFPAVNKVYGQYVGAGAMPARSTIQVAGLPLGARIEIEAIALVPAHG